MVDIERIQLGCRRGACHYGEAALVTTLRRRILLQLSQTNRYLFATDAVPPVLATRPRDYFC